MPLQTWPSWYIHGSLHQFAARPWNHQRLIPQTFSTVSGCTAASLEMADQFHLVQVYFKSPSHSVDRVIYRPSLQAQTRTLIITLDSHLEDLQNTTRGNSVIESSMLYLPVRETRQKETNPWQVAVYGDVSTAPVSTQWTMPCRCLTSSMSATIPGTRSLWHSYEEEFSRLEWLAE